MREQTLLVNFYWNISVSKTLLSLESRRHAWIYFCVVMPKHPHVRSNLAINYLRLSRTIITHLGWILTLWLWVSSDLIDLSYILPDFCQSWMRHAVQINEVWFSLQLDASDRKNLLKEWFSLYTMNHEADSTNSESFILISLTNISPNASWSITIHSRACRRNCLQTEPHQVFFSEGYLIHINCISISSPQQHLLNFRTSTMELRIHKLQTTKHRFGCA